MSAAELTVSLDRSGSTLARRYHWPNYSNAANTSAPWTSLGANFSYGDARGLDAIAALLDDGREAALDTNFTRSRLLEVGAVLFELLFGTTEEMREIFRRRFGTAHAPDTGPRRQPVRLRICTSDPILSGLPFRLTAYQGHWLIDDGWTFEVTGLERAELAVNLQVPCKILVAAPQVSGLPGLGTEFHLDSLREMLGRISPQYHEEQLFHVVRTRAELVGALHKFEPVIFYYYGHGEINDRQACLILENNGRRDEILLSDVKMNLRDPAPRIVYLNACKAGGGGWTSAGHQLSPAVPLVIAHRTTAWTDYAGVAAISWLQACLTTAKDPLLPLHQLPAEATRRDYQWATTSVHASYATWTTRAAARRRRNPEEGLRLDRAEQRAFVLNQVLSEMPNDAFRVEALIAYGAHGNSVDKFAQQAIDHLESKAGPSVAIKRARLEFPAHRAALEKSLEAELMRSLRAERYDELPDVLRRAAPERRAAQMSILWIDWGVFGTAPGTQPPLRTQELQAWVSFCCNRLTPACQPDMRIVSFLALELEEKSHKLVRDEVAALQRRYRRPREFSFNLLAPLPSLEFLHILSFLENPEYASCPPGLADKAAELIFTKTAGRYDAAVELIKQAERTTWHQLVDELENSAVGEAAEEGGGLIA